MSCLTSRRSNGPSKNYTGTSVIFTIFPVFSLSIHFLSVSSWSVVLSTIKSVNFFFFLSLISLSSHIWFLVKKHRFSFKFISKKLLQATGGHGAREEAEPKKLKLYSYWLSSCSCRVRIGLDLKGSNPL